MQGEGYIAAAQQEDTKDKAPSIARSTAKMSVATAFSRATGYLRIMVLAYALGDSILNDTYTTANVMPSIVFELIMGGILGSVIIPVYVQYLNEKSEHESRYMINNLTNIIMLIAIVASVLGAVFSPYIVKLITLREPAKATAEMVMFFRIFSFKIAFFALAAVFSGVLNSHRKFTVPMTAPILNNVIVIATVLGLFIPLRDSNPGLALLLLALGTTAGIVGMALVQVPIALRSGMGFQWSLDFRHPAVKQVGLLALPMLGFAMTVQVNNFLIYMLVQEQTRGAMAYNNALQFFQLPYAIFAVSVTTAIFPELSRFASSRDFSSFKRTLSLGLRSTSFIIIPSAIFMIVMARPIIELTLEHGNFGPQGTAITSTVLQSFAVALLSFSLYNMLTRVYYSLQDTKTPMKIGAVTIPVQIAFNFVLIEVLGVRGLPLSYALALTIAVAIQLYILRRKIGPLGASFMLRGMGKQVAAAIPMGIVVYFVHYGMQGIGMPRTMGLAVELVAAMGAGAAVYVGLALLMGVDEVDVIKKISRRFSRARMTNA